MAKKNKDEEVFVAEGDNYLDQEERAERDANVLAQPGKDGLEQVESEPVEFNPVASATPIPPSAGLSGDEQIAARLPTEVIRDEREVQEAARPVVNVDYSLLDDPDLMRLAAISGGLSGLAPFKGDGKQRAHGFLTLLNVHDQTRQVQLYPGALIPEGLWVSVRQVPEQYLVSLGNKR